MSKLSFISNTASLVTNSLDIILDDALKTQAIKQQELRVRYEAERILYTNEQREKTVETLTKVKEGQAKAIATNLTYNTLISELFPDSK